MSPSEGWANCCELSLMKLPPRSNFRYFLSVFDKVYIPLSHINNGMADGAMAASALKVLKLYGNN